jgi:hypothetical protein
MQCAGGGLLHHMRLRLISFQAGSSAVHELAVHLPQYTPKYLHTTHIKGGSQVGHSGREGLM